MGVICAHKLINTQSYEYLHLRGKVMASVRSGIKVYLWKKQDLVLTWLPSSYMCNLMRETMVL